MVSYKTEFFSNKLNEKFWEEVLVDRKITKVNFTHSDVLNKGWLESFELDSGEIIHIVDGTIMIKNSDELKFADELINCE